LANREDIAPAVSRAILRTSIVIVDRNELTQSGSRIIADP
jgi:hypothetical protein